MLINYFNLPDNYGILAYNQQLQVKHEHHIHVYGPAIISLVDIVWGTRHGVLIICYSIGSSNT